MMAVGAAGSIVGALLEQAGRTPGRPALLFGGEVWSYGRLLGDAGRWAAALRRWGVRPGDRAALFLENSATFVTAYLGVHLAGGIVVLVNTQYRQVELRHILGDAAVRLCITDQARLGELARVEGELPELAGIVVVDAGGASGMGSQGAGLTEEASEGADADRAASGGAAPGGPAGAGESGRLGSSGRAAGTGDAAIGLDGAGSGAAGVAGRRAARIAAGEFLAGAEAGRLQAPEPEAVAVIGYTSGTTGRSKGAMLRHRNLAANSAAIAEAWRWTAHDRLLDTLPLFHVHGLCVGVHTTLLVGAVVDLRARFEAAAVYDELLRGETTMFFGVPTMYTRLIAEARARRERPRPIRLYVSGSAPLSAQTFAEFRELFGQPILERYGMTETLMNLTNPYDGERRPGTVGQPFPGQEARIVDVRTRQPIADERPGEIQVRGPHVFKGYWRLPEATAEAFDAEGWFNTGDLGWRSADGYYTISGRARELIISGGYNIYPREVEEVLLTDPAVAEAAVLGLPDPEYGERVVAAVVPRAGAVADQEELAAALIARCRDQLASYKKPRRVVFVDALPRNALGKIQKHILREQLEG